MTDEKTPAKDGTDHQIAESNWLAYCRARDGGHSTYVDQAKKYNRFFLGDQWDEAVLAELEEEGRPALTINMVLPVINAVCGQQRGTRAEVSLKPKRGKSSQETAKVMSKLIHHIFDDNDFEYVESQTFDDGVIEERGWFDIRMDYDDNVLGEVKITSQDPGTVLLDPDASGYEPSTWNEVIKSEWYSLDDIEAQFGKAVADRLGLMPLSQSYGKDSVEYAVPTYGDQESNVAAFGTVMDDDEAHAVRSVRVIERQHRRLHLRQFFVDPNYGDMRPVPDHWDDERREQFAERFGLSIIKRLEKRIRWTTTADKTVLFDGWSPYRSFTKVLFSPYFRRGEPMGLIRNLISPQEQYNKLSSQELHIVNTTANSGWVLESGSLNGMTTQELRASGSKTGLVLEFNKGATPPSKIQPNTIPTGIDRISQKSVMQLKEISGINDSMLGYDSPEVSGVAIEKKQGRGLVQLGPVFDNLARSRKLVAAKCLELIHDFYTEPRVYSITDYTRSDTPQEELAINQQSADGAVINDVTEGLYDVVISTIPARDTFNDNQFAEIISLRAAGVMIPDDAVIRYSNLADKFDLADRVSRIAGTGEPTPEEAEKMAAIEQLEMQMMQGQLAELNAKISDLQAKAQLNMAKAASESQSGADGQPSGVDPTIAFREQMENMRLQVKLESEAENLEKELNNRLLAIQYQTKADTSRDGQSQLMGMLKSEQEGKQRLREAALRSAAKPSGAQNGSGKTAQSKDGK